MSERVEKIRMALVGRDCGHTRICGCAALDRDEALAHLEAVVAELEEVRHERDLLESGAMDCVTCGRLTGNGECTECRRGISPFKKLQAENDRLRTEFERATGGDLKSYALLQAENERLREEARIWEADASAYHHDRRALAERVKADCAFQASIALDRNDAAARIRALDLEPLLTPESKP